MESVKRGGKMAWRWIVESTICFRLYLLFVVAFQIASIFKEQLGINMIFTITKVIQEWEFWRLISSWIVPNPNHTFSIISWLLSIWTLAIVMPSLEKRLSTVYIFFQFFKQILLLNLVISIFFYPLIIFNLIDARQIVLGGAVYTSLIFLIMDCLQDPDGSFNIFCLECFLSKKFLPVMVILGILASFSTNILVMAVTIVFEIIQFGCMKKPFLAFPLKFYGRIDGCVPLRVRGCLGWIEVESVEEGLSEVSRAWKQDDEIVIKDASKGERKKIKPSGQASFKHHWLNKGDSEQPKDGQSKRRKKKSKKKGKQQGIQMIEQQIIHNAYERSAQFETNENVASVSPAVEENEQLSEYWNKNQDESSGNNQQDNRIHVDVGEKVLSESKPPVILDYRSVWSQKEISEQAINRIVEEKPIVFQPSPVPQFENKKDQPYWAKQTPINIESAVNRDSYKQDIQAENQLEPEVVDQKQKKAPLIDPSSKVAAAIDDDEQWY